jgi:DNA-binding response OmpR family regulator
MAPATKDGKKKRLPAAPWGELPPHMRVLFITGLHRTGSWLAEAFAADSAVDVQLDEAIGLTNGLARLRDDVFDAVLISHEGESLDALDLLEAIRAGSHEQQPIVVLGAQSEQEMSALCYEAGGDAYVCVNATTTRTLIWEIARAIERRRLMADVRRLQQEQRHRLQLEHDEATRLLVQQRGLIEQLEHLRRGQHEGDGELVGGEPLMAAPDDLPSKLVEHYRELLRTHVIMGSGNLSGEMGRLADMLASAGVTARQAVQLHLHVLEEMIRGLGNRSSRHVMNRADLLILEVIVDLAESYRERYFQRIHPPKQLLLPGIDDPRAAAAA